MARSISSAKVFSALVVDGISTASVAKRGYTAATRGAVARAEGARNGAAVAIPKKAGEDMSSTENVAWVPDPITGCYKPQNRLHEIDAAELRAALFIGSLIQK